MIHMKTYHEYIFSFFFSRISVGEQHNLNSSVGYI